MPELIVTTAEAGLSIEVFLQQRLQAAPAAYLRKLLKDGKIRRGNDIIVADTLLAAGELIWLPDSRRLIELLQESKATAVSIIYENNQLLIVDKPAGLATHAGKGHEQDNLTARIETLLKRRGETFMVAPIQRLDLETSGPVLFGKGKKNCSALGTMMMNEPVAKTYLALVTGKLPGSGVLVSDIPAKGKIKTAETAYQVLASTAAASLLRIELHTGRQHQIRRQFSNNGHPLFGDRRYRGLCPASLPRLFLHCYRLAFCDPFSDQQLDIRAELPPELLSFLSIMGMDLPSEFDFNFDPGCN